MALLRSPVALLPAGLLLAAALLVPADPARADPPGSAPAAAATSIDPAVSPLPSGLDTISQHFLRELPRGQLDEMALKALVEKLDPYSTYYTAGETQVFLGESEGHFVGIGVTLAMDDAAGYPRIEHLIYGGVAGPAGVRESDLLLAVDSHDIKGESYEQVVDRLRGAVGSTVQLQLRRAGSAAPLSLAIARASIALPSVLALRRDARGEPDWWLDRVRKIGYLRITALADDTVAGVDAAVAKLQRGGARGLVLDLRDCRGGKMHAALDTADLFVARGRLLTIRQRGEDQNFDAAPGKYTRLPLVLLINAGTASSGEILAGAIADNGRAKLVGERSFGKGRIQTFYSLGEGRGAMVLSTGTFQRPNGKTIDKHDIPEGSKEPAGIAPDVEVKMGEAEHAAWQEFADKSGGPTIFKPEQLPAAPADPQLDKAIELLGL